MIGEYRISCSISHEGDDMVFLPLHDGTTQRSIRAWFGVLNPHDIVGGVAASLIGFRLDAILLGVEGFPLSRATCTKVGAWSQADLLTQELFYLAPKNRLGISFARQVDRALRSLTHELPDEVVIVNLHGDEVVAKEFAAELRGLATRGVRDRPAMLDASRFPLLGLVEDSRRNTGPVSADPMSLPQLLARESWPVGAKDGAVLLLPGYSGVTGLTRQSEGPSQPDSVIWTRPEETADLFGDNPIEEGFEAAANIYREYLVDENCGGELDAVTRSLLLEEYVFNLFFEGERDPRTPRYWKDIASRAGIREFPTSAHERLGLNYGEKLAGLEKNLVDQKGNVFVFTETVASLLFAYRLMNLGVVAQCIGHTEIHGLLHRPRVPIRDEGRYDAA